MLSRAPSIDEVENIEMDSEEKVRNDSKVNGETDGTSDSKEHVDVDSLNDIDDDEVYIKSVVENPDMRRESIAEIKRLAEGIVQKGDGRGLLCSVDSGNMTMNGNDFKPVEESQPPQQKHASVIITNPSVDLAASGSPVSGGTTGIILSLFLIIFYFTEDLKCNVRYLSKIAIYYLLMLLIELNY